MKLRITGASNFVNRMFEACGSYQWAREFLRNSLEAGAQNIDFGIEWQAVRTDGVYRRIIADDGAGMTADELLRFFSTLGEGGKKIGGVHDNFGVGAKIAALPWNSEGVVVISYKQGVGSMIWIVLDQDSGDYELVEFDTDSGKKCVIPPSEVDGFDWATVRPDWITEHGTLVVLLGSSGHPDTVLGNPHAGEDDIKGLSVYLNTRFWDLTNTKVTVAELRSEKKSQWPQSEHDRDNARRPNNRGITGARYYLTYPPGCVGGRPKAQDTLLLDDGRVAAEWYLWEGERPAVHSYAKKSGYIAVRYKGELFHMTASKLHFRWFGIIEAKVQQNLTIILEPKLYQPSNGRWGVHPDQSRNRLIFTGGGEQGIDLPLSDWALEFADNMPEEILEVIRQARGDHSGSIDDEEYRKRLQDRFGSRWTVRRMVQARKNDVGKLPATLLDEEVPITTTSENDDEEPRPPRRKRKKGYKVGRPKAVAGGPDEMVEIDSPVDVPRYRFGGADLFEKDWHLALWAPNDPEGPTVVVNIEAPTLVESVQHHQALYPDVYAEEIADLVRKAFGEIAACKVAHSQKLAQTIPQEQLDREYRSEQSLTIALMGLLGEEALIAQRLIKLGRKKAAA